MPDDITFEGRIVPMDCDASTYTVLTLPDEFAVALAAQGVKRAETRAKRILKLSTDLTTRRAKRPCPLTAPTLGSGPVTQALRNEVHMIFGVPRAPLLLGLAGLIPFFWGSLTVIWPDLGLWGSRTLGNRFTGPYVQLFYGAVILSFMSGVLWGFATKSEHPAGYVLSVIPALWAFFMTGGGPTTAAINLIVGFLALLLLDWHFWRLGATPGWWMRLRVLLTALVILSYLPVVL